MCDLNFEVQKEPIKLKLKQGNKMAALTRKIDQIIKRNHKCGKVEFLIEVYVGTNWVSVSKALGYINVVTNDFYIDVSTTREIQFRLIAKYEKFIAATGKPFPVKVEQRFDVEIVPSQQCVIKF
jgi:hypothetical protein